jgi:Lar family restriction alleviation protein
MKINKCPKCGREPEVIRLERNFVLSAYEVECYDCGLHTGRYGTRDEAIAKWNEITKGENK